MKDLRRNELIKKINLELHTNLGLNKDDKFGLDFSKIGNNKFFYDVIYSPFQTEFAEAGNAKGNVIENGFNMFWFQGQQAFNIWHNVEPEINKELIEFLKKWNYEI